MFCCAGHTAPRLYGMWTGEWNPAWSAAYTMDANVNLQVSGMNIGNAPEAVTGYCAFVRRQLEDWEGNACQVYGMTDALLVPVNTDGRRAMMVEYDGEYPFEYWNAGAAWMALPVFEAWQCFGLKVVRVRSSQLPGNRGPCVESGRKQLHRRGAPDLVLPHQHTVFSSVPPNLQTLLSGR